MLLDRLRSSANTLGRGVLHALPSPIQRYAVSVASLGAGVSVTELCYLVFGPHLPPLLTGPLVLAFLFVILGAAWLGYGPGILVVALLNLALHYLRPYPNRTLRAELTRFGLMLVASVLVFSIGCFGSAFSADLGQLKVLRFATGLPGC